MDIILRGYSVNEPTWFYLSLLLIIAVFFRFGRLWSLRNLDLILLLSISPGLLIVRELPDLGYSILFATTGLILLRLMFDCLLRRRPRMEQNLTPAGMLFLSIAAFWFLMAKVATEPPPQSTVNTVRQADNLLKMEDASKISSGQGDEEKLTAGPTTSLLTAPVVPLTSAVTANAIEENQDSVDAEIIAARTVAILAHAAVICGLLFLGRNQFGDIKIGLSMATLYLLLPCTAYDVGKVNHVLPAALLIWSLVAYRKPMIAGGLMGLACGAMFFPVFLLPLWATFYGKRGVLRFGLGLLIVGAVLLGTLVMTSADAHSFTLKTIGSIDWSILNFQGSEASGFWSQHPGEYRLPVIVAFAILVIALTIWPRKKTLEHLISHSAAVIVAIQFWYPHQGGVYLLWYIPLVLAAVFRPRLSKHKPPQLQEAEEKQQVEPVLETPAEPSELLL